MRDEGNAEIALDEGLALGILADLSIRAEAIRPIEGSFSKRIFIVDERLVLRVSPSPMDRELANFRRVAALDSVPKLKGSGIWNPDGDRIHYLLVDCLPGMDAMEAWAGLSADEGKELGAAIARFLEGLHELRADRYDIGHYEPTLPSFEGSWSAGHASYWAMLESGCEGLDLGEGQRRAVREALGFVRRSRGALDFELGPRVLHNDFHPRNIMVEEGRFSGVIDWECSQRGELDFDFAHLLHWTAFPPDAGTDLRPLLASILSSSRLRDLVPDLSTRLAVYLIEEDLMQLIWSRGSDQERRAQRLEAWLDGLARELVEGC